MADLTVSSAVDTFMQSSDQAAMQAAVGLSAADPNVACLRSNGNDATGVIGNQFKPFLTAQAAVDAFGSADNIYLNAGVGSFGNVNATGHSAPSGSCKIKIQGVGNQGGEGSYFGNFTCTDGPLLIQDCGINSFNIGNISTFATGANGFQIDLYSVTCNNITTDGDAASVIGDVGWNAGNVAIYGACEIAGNISCKGGKGGAGDGGTLSGDGGLGGNVYFFQRAKVVGNVDRSGGAAGNDGGAGVGSVGAAGELEGGSGSRIVGTITPDYVDECFGFVIGEPPIFYENAYPDSKIVSGGYTVTQADNGKTIFVTGAGTIVLPPVSVGFKVTVITIGAIAVSVDPNGADLIVRDGTAQADGEKITNLSTAGDIAVLTYYDATGWYAATNAWTNGG